MTTLANDPAVKKLSVRIGNLEVRSYSEELKGMDVAGGQALQANAPGLGSHHNSR